MQAMTVAVQQQVEPVEKINPVSAHKIKSSYIDVASPKPVSFSDRVDQAKNEQAVQPEKNEAPAARTEKKSEAASKETKQTAAEKTPASSVRKEAVRQDAADAAAVKVKTVSVKTAKKTAAETDDGSHAASDAQAKAKKTAAKKTGSKDDEAPYSKELAYLQGQASQKPADPLDEIIAHAEEYKVTAADKAKTGLEKAQRLSVEAPQQFLSEQQTASKMKKDGIQGALSDAAKDKDTKTAQKKKFALDKDGKIIVTDLRTEPEKEVAKQIKNAVNKTAAAKSDGDGTNQMTMDFAGKIQQNILSSTDQNASAAGSNFQAMLTNQIQQNAEDFVKAGSIVLKDNNAGTINLVLHPESLGNVKISLQLADKVITGQITVSSREAYNAFKDSADSLKQAFVQNGFETSGFTVAYSDAGTGSGSFNGNSRDESSYSLPQVTGSYGNAELADAIPAMSGSYVSADHSLNIVA